MLNTIRKLTFKQIYHQNTKTPKKKFAAKDAKSVNNNSWIKTFPSAQQDGGPTAKTLNHKRGFSLEFGSDFINQLYSIRRDFSGDSIAISALGCLEGGRSPFK